MMRRQWVLCGMFIIMATLVIFTLLGNSSTSTIRLSSQLPANTLYLELKQDYANFTNLNFVGPIKNFKQYKVIVISYNDFSGEHYVNYHFVKELKSGMEILGGGGGVSATNVPLSFGVGGGSSDSEEYVITYGEVYDNKIKTIELVYVDNQKVSQSVMHNGYLFIRTQYKGWVKSLKGIDENGSVIITIGSYEA